MNDMSLNTYIKLLVEFEEKVESHLNKKYKSFIRKVINWDALAKNVNQDRIKLTKELIVFQLGLEAKSHKAIEISLTYLVKMFQHKFVDLNMPNYCECFTIEETGVKEIEGVQPKQQVRHLLISLMKHCLNYKKNEIFELIVKVLENLITQPILDLILDATAENPQISTSKLLFNFFSFRFLIYEQICYYSQSEMASFNILTVPSQKFDKEIKRAHEEQKQLEGLIGRYMVEYLSIIDGVGGRYGLCVICGQPAEHYCKVTKASLCGIDCKKKHIELADTQYKHQFQATYLWESIYTCFRDLLLFLEQNQNSTAFGVLTSLLEKPFLFMVIKHQFRALISRHIPNIFSKLLKYKTQLSFQNIYIFMSSLTKYWMNECIPTIQFFFKEYIIKVLEDKKPSYRFLTFVFKALAKILEKGKVTIQLYINFDCEVNKDNILEKVLFELAKIVQDRFINVALFSKAEKLNIKNHCLSLFIIMSMGLNEYRKHELQPREVSDIVELKQKKMSLEQFVVRFNEHWTNGLKTLFNLNLVGLDSNQEIVDILQNLRGLKKDNIDDYFTCEKGQELLDIFIKKVIKKNKNNLFLSLVDIYHCVPLKINSFCLKKFIKQYENSYELKMERQLEVYVQFLCGSYILGDLKTFISKHSEHQKLPHEMEALYHYAVNTRATLTTGNKTKFFTHCCSKDYLEVMSSQLTLLQIPLSYLLQNDYELQRLLGLTEELVQICPHSNWLSLMIKNTSLNYYPSAEFDQQKMKVVLGILNIMEKEAHFIENWTLIVSFISQINSIFRLIESKKITEGRVALSERLNMDIVERCLMQAGSRCGKHFSQLLLAMIFVAKEEVDKEILFMTHKFFDTVDSNPKKFILVVDQILPFLTNFTKHLEKSSAETCISIADMLKQSFAKLLKLPKQNQKWVNESEAQFWVLFQDIANNKNREVRDFVVNCITMTILHFYQISYKSWITLFSFMKGHVKEYRQQVLTIVEKIVSEKMVNCEDFYPDLVELCLELVDEEQTKFSIESLHALKNVLQLTSQIKVANRGQILEEETGFRQLRNIIVRVEEFLINLIFFNCHQDIIDTFFNILRFKVHDQLVLTGEQTDQLIENLFLKVEQFSEKTLQISEKTLSVSLSWSVSNKYENILTFFQKLVVDKYNLLSLSAIKCLKTYIQMINPKQRQQWTSIQACLLAISRNTRISDQINLQIPNKYDNFQQHFELEDTELIINLNMFTNKMVVQKSIVEMLPNHIQCFEEVSLLYQEITSFNDHLYLRCLLWRRGLGAKDRAHPPNLLSLEEIIGGKLVAIYNSAKEDEIVDFSLTFFTKYCQASSQLQAIEEYLDNPEKANLQMENTSLLKDYLTCRKSPLIKVMGYFLPKFTRFCQGKGQRRQIVLSLVDCLKYVDNRDPVLKAVKDLTKE